MYRDLPFRHSSFC